MVHQRCYVRLASVSSILMTNCFLLQNVRADYLFLTLWRGELKCLPRCAYVPPSFEI